jgi:hypothetical protein
MMISFSFVGQSENNSFSKDTKEKEICKTNGVGYSKEMKEAFASLSRNNPKQENKNGIIGCSDVHVARPLQDCRRSGERLHTREKDGL